MSFKSILLLGATGETGGDILNGLLEDGGFDITCLVQPSSVEKPAVKTLTERGLKIKVIDIRAAVEELAHAISGYDTIISCIGPQFQALQVPLADAAAFAGTVKRFVPCGFTTISPPGGIMHLRDWKEEVHAGIFRNKIPYTIVDVGYWHQLSYPSVPSGKVDYAKFWKEANLYGDGEAKNLLTDKRDMGRFLARIIKDERTINKRVFTHSDALSQNEIFTLLEKLSGEKITPTVVSKEKVLKDLDEARAKWAAGTGQKSGLYVAEYNYSKYIRGDNTPENAKYLGYLDARELYPDFKPISFEHYLQEVLDGKGVRPYPSLTS